MKSRVQKLLALVMAFVMLFEMLPTQANGNIVAVLADGSGGRREPNNQKLWRFFSPCRFL